MNPRSTLAIVAAVAVGSAGLGWVLGRQIKSPADLAAEARAPAASLITVPVERKVLSSDIVIRGQVGFSESTDITVSGVSGGSSIITRVPKAEGETLLEGDTVVELAGRPLIALQGDLPAFRSLAPGVEGPDVQQLEEALVRLGFDPGSVDDRYDAATEVAVSQLYRDRGYKPNEPTAEDLERVEQARKSVERIAGQTLPNGLNIRIGRIEGDLYGKALTVEFLDFLPSVGVLDCRKQPGLGHDRMALKLNGKDERLKRSDFLSVSAIAGLRASDTNAAIDDVLARLRVAVAAITLPHLSNYGLSGEAAVSQTLDICRDRIDSFA